MLEQLRPHQPIVHGDIRHLEISELYLRLGLWVHGDIRHLETSLKYSSERQYVHGDIRHLENQFGLCTAHL